METQFLLSDYFGVFLREFEKGNSQIAENMSGEKSAITQQPPGYGQGYDNIQMQPAYNAHQVAQVSQPGEFFGAFFSCNILCMKIIAK